MTAYTSCYAISHEEPLGPEPVVGIQVMGFKGATAFPAYLARVVISLVDRNTPFPIPVDIPLSCSFILGKLALPAWVRWTLPLVGCFGP